MGIEQNPPLRRSRSGAVVGGVCAGVAGYFGVDPLLVRAVAVLLGIASMGTAVLAYLLAWVLIPGDGATTPTTTQATTSATTPEASPPAEGVGAAWSAANAELRSLAAQLRPAPADPESAPPGAVSRPRAAVETVDATMTAVGERLRDPAVQATARRAAQHASAALTAGVADIGRRVSRSEDRPHGPDHT